MARARRRRPVRRRGALLGRFGPVLLALLVVLSFVTRRLARSEAPVAPPAAPSPSGAESFGPAMAPEDCARIAAPGRSRRRPGRLRIGTWNLRWFPDGRPGAPKSGTGPRATRVQRLACEIAGLGVDLLLMQEIKRTPRAERALAALAGRLNALTGGAWKVEIDGCRGKGRQHLALLFDARSLRLQHRRDVAALNPHGGACAHMMRPGLAAYFTRPGGADFHLVGVHLKSGTERGDLQARTRSVEAIAEAYADAQRLEPDADVVIAGDFNTMGCARCKPKVSVDDELASVDAILAGLDVPFRRVPADLACSEYYRGRGKLIDHFIVSKDMGEVRSNARAETGGFCAKSGCGAWRAGEPPPSAYLELSDHCPVVLELDDVDRD